MPDFGGFEFFGFILLAAAAWAPPSISGSWAPAIHRNIKEYASSCQRKSQQINEVGEIMPDHGHSARHRSSIRIVGTPVVHAADQSRQEIVGVAGAKRGHGLCDRPAIERRRRRIGQRVNQRGDDRLRPVAPDADQRCIGIALPSPGVAGIQRLHHFESKNLPEVPERRPIEKQARAYGIPGTAQQTPAQGAQEKPVMSTATQPPKAEIKKKLWYCRQCGYVVFREDPPYICPICKAKREMFAEVEAKIEFTG